MSKNLEQIGLKSIVSQYDLFFIDIWGVIHNGIKLYENAVQVLEKLSNNNKEFIPSAMDLGSGNCALLSLVNYFLT